MICVIDNEIVIQDCEPDLLNKLERELTFANPEYAKKERMGLWTGNTPKTLCLVWKRGNQIGIPFGMLQVIADNRNRFSNIVNRVTAGRDWPPIEYESDIVLYDYQSKAVEAALGRRNGVIIAPCGSGKTQMGLDIVSELGKRTLWLTHTTDLLTQSMERAKSVFGLPEEYYGTITAGKVRVGSCITFATVQTMAKMDLSIVKDAFDVVIVDEAHHCVGTPAKVQMFYKVVSALSARYKFGLTATPTRQDGLIGCMYALLGGEIYRVTPEQVAQNLCPVEVRFKDTGYTPNYDVVLSSDGTLQYTSLVTDIVSDKARNKKIVEDVWATPGCSLILTDRVSHAQELYFALGELAAVLVGKVSKKDRETALEAIRSGRKRYLVATYAIAREGLDIPCLDNVFMTTPKKDQTSVVQAAGRVARKFEGKTIGIVHDYVDDFGMLRGWAKKRAGFYKKAGYSIAF